MHPAYSVILFTSASGAGYGLLVWLALAMLGVLEPLSSLMGFWVAVVALVLISTGLLASTFHLGHPERAWRAFSQWRSSWLSREGVLAVLTYPFALVFTAAWLWNGLSPVLVAVCTVLLIVLCLCTVVATGMIYASLKTIPRWSNSWVVPVYLLMAVASGGLMFAFASSVSLGQSRLTSVMVLAVLLVAWLVKWRYWQFIDKQKPQSTPGTATGLASLGEVRQLDAPHTSENYLLQEMGYVVARKHAQRLRRMAMILGLLVPALGIVLASLVPGLAIPLVLLAVISGMTGIVIERWLFFAEARHVVTLFYGRSM